MRREVHIPQHVIDQHTLIAQKYVGWFAGHPVSAMRWNEVPMYDVEAVTVDRSREWREPLVIRDDCIFCQRLTDESAVRRVFAYQAAIDKETLTSSWDDLKIWLRSLPDDVPGITYLYWADPTVLTTPEGEVYVPHRDVDKMASNWGNRRAYLEWLDANSQYEMTPRAVPMVDLPLRLKRKLCIEWDHLYLDWMRIEEADYDFEKHEFYREARPEEIDPRELNIWDGS